MKVRRDRARLMALKAILALALSGQFMHPDGAAACTATKPDRLLAARLDELLGAVVLACAEPEPLCKIVISDADEILRPWRACGARSCAFGRVCPSPAQPADAAEPPTWQACGEEPGR